MNDISDLHGIIPTSLRWNAEGGVLGRSIFDEATGERTIAVIELGSNEAKMAMDYPCRERGYGRIRQGSFDMRLTPVGAPVPPWPGDDEFKPAIGCWLWNPIFGELRLETNQSTFLRAVTAAWEHCRSYKEASDGQVPVLFFESRREQFYPTIGKSFWSPVIQIIGWVERDRVPPFALRQPTIKPPALAGQASFVQLEKPSTLQTQLTEKLAGKKSARKQGTAAKPGAAGDDLNDDLIPF